MLGHKRRLNAIDEIRKTREMPLEPRFAFRVDVRRTDREADAVQRDRIARANVIEHAEVVAAFAEVVLAVDLEPVDRRLAVEECAVVRRAKPDACGTALDIECHLSRRCFPAFAGTAITTS
jgi:hypothetical protein